MDNTKQSSLKTRVSDGDGLVWRVGAPAYLIRCGLPFLVAFCLMCYVVATVKPLHEVVTEIKDPSLFFMFEVRVNTPLVLLALVWMIAGVYSFFMLRSVKLYTNDYGVWMYRGIFPWNKGAYGIKWMDYNDSLMINSLLAWVFNSNKILLRPLHSNAPVVETPHIKNPESFLEHASKAFEAYRSKT